MANLTVVIDDDLLKRARIKALEEGTSVNAIVREHLERYAGESGAEEAKRRFLEFAASSTWSSGGWEWDRDEVHRRW